MRILHAVVRSWLGGHWLWRGWRSHGYEVRLALIGSTAAAERESVPRRIRTTHTSTLRLLERVCWGLAHSITTAEECQFLHKRTCLCVQTPETLYPYGAGEEGKKNVRHATPHLIVGTHACKSSDPWLLGRDAAHHTHFSVCYSCHGTVFSLRADSIYLPLPSSLSPSIPPSSSLPHDPPPSLMTSLPRDPPPSQLLTVRVLLPSTVVGEAHGYVVRVAQAAVRCSRRGRRRRRRRRRVSFAPLSNPS